MDLFGIYILGLVQGLTEFFPVSSSGHLVIFKNFLDIGKEQNMIEIFLHGGTLFSILFYYKQDIQIECKNILKRDYQFLFNVCIAIIPVIIVALIFKNSIETIFFKNENRFLYIAISYMFCALILFSTKFFIQNKKNKISIFSAFIIGVFQCIALLPGISRSGFTISTALFLGVKKEEATRFSFLIAIPVILGGFCLDLYENFDIIFSDILPLAVGFFTSAIVGYYVILYVVKLVNKDKMWIFSTYCFILSIISLTNHI